MTNGTDFLTLKNLLLPLKDNTLCMKRGLTNFLTGRLLLIITIKTPPNSMRGDTDVLWVLNRDRFDQTELNNSNEPRLATQTLNS